MKVSLDKFLIATKFTTEALGLAITSSEKKAKGKNYPKILADLDKHFKGLIIETIEAEEFDFSAGATLAITLSSQNKVATNVATVKKIILVGLGEESKLDTKVLRKAAAALIRSAKSNKIEKLTAIFPKNPEILAEASILISYEFDKYKSVDKSADKKTDKKDKKLSELKILVETLEKTDKEAVRNAVIRAEATCTSRDLVWEPACVVTPSYLAEQAKKILNPKNNTIKVKILEQKDCEKLGMGAYLAVSQGSDQPPKFIEITYTPVGKVKKHIALVGKGVTFDSGGLSLKPAKSMEMMKEDMSGAAAIIGIMNAIAKTQPKGVQITAIIAATENMPSGRAYRPGDVIIAMNGKTIEVNNTDAEGRLTLADAVAYVSKKDPDEIIDFATLTGACMVALGNVCAGLMTNNQELLERVKASAERTGELMWQLPLYDEYKEGLKSTIADLINAGSGGKAGAQNGGLFIQEFIGKKKDSEEIIPWLHIDIAGPCWFDQDMDWSPKGASGIPVRTILDYISTQA